MLRKNSTVSIVDNVAYVENQVNYKQSFFVKFNKEASCFEYNCPALNLSERIYSASTLEEAVDDAFYQLRSHIIAYGAAFSETL